MPQSVHFLDVYRWPDILYHTFTTQGDHKGAQVRLWDISTGAVSAQLKAADSLRLTTHLSDVPVSWCTDRNATV
jgi:hypothetical protein